MAVTAAGKGSGVRARDGYLGMARRVVWRLRSKFGSGGLSELAGFAPTPVSNERDRMA